MAQPSRLESIIDLLREEGVEFMCITDLAHFTPRKQSLRSVIIHEQSLWAKLDFEGYISFAKHELLRQGLRL